MGWLLACFGCPKKRKRPKKASKFGPKCRKIGSYQRLESDVPEEVDASQQPLSFSNSAPGDKPKDEKKTSMRKRVRFNLEVTTYELLPPDDHITTHSLEFEDNNNCEGSEEEEDTSNVFLGYVPLCKPSYASNHRYNNCCEDEDEYHDDYDNDVEDELSDLDDDEEDEDEDEYNSCLIDADKVYHEEIIPEDHHHIISMPILSGRDGSKLNTRLRSHCVVPVLNPIENLSQWKAVKARIC